MGAHVSNVIRFLETMGSSALMARMTMAEYEAAIAGLEVADEQRVALGMRDQKAIGLALDVRPSMLCFVFAPDQEENAPSPEEEGGEVPNPEEDSPVKE
jgi:hypothetical protein